MIGVGVGSATGGYSKGSVLKGLEFLKIGVRGDRRPDGAGVFYDGTGDCFVCCGDGVFVFAPL